MKKKQDSTAKEEEKFWKAVDKIAEESAEKEREGYQSKLEPFNVYKQKLKSRVHNSMEELLAQCTRAYETIIADLFGSKPQEAGEEVWGIADEITAGVEHLAKYKDTKQLEQALSEGKTFQELMNYSDKTLARFYKIGMDRFQREDYERAGDIFSLLTFLNPCYHNFWVCLGMSCQAHQRWENAILAYEMAQYTNKEDPLAYYHAGQCYLHINDKVKANLNLKEALRCAGREKAYAYVKQQVENFRRHMV